MMHQQQRTVFNEVIHTPAPKTPCWRLSSRLPGRGLPPLLCDGARLHHVVPTTPKAAPAASLLLCLLSSSSNRAGTSCPLPTRGSPFRDQPVTNTSQHGLKVSCVRIFLRRSPLIHGGREPVIELDPKSQVPRSQPDPSTEPFQPVQIHVH